MHDTISVLGIAFGLPRFDRQECDTYWKCLEMSSPNKSAYKLNIVTIEFG